MTVKVTFVLKNGTEINRMQTKTLNSPDKFEKQLKSEILAAMKDPASIYSFGASSRSVFYFTVKQFPVK